MKTAIIGGGSWGTALGAALARAGNDSRLWAREEEVVSAINTAHENPRYLPGIRLPENLSAHTAPQESLEGAELVVLVTPSHVTREVLVSLQPHLPANVPLVCATKGIENDTLMTMSEVLEDVLPPEQHPYLSFLSGPSFAAEVARDLPTVVVVAARWERIARQVQQAFSLPFFRVYTSSDVMGVELGGALKNVIALAAGASDGLGFGHNARSALITRGLVEISRLALKKGAQSRTLSGLAGMGDLVLTCTGELSRNRQVGFRLGQGESLSEVLGSMTQVAEGVKTARSAVELARSLEVEMPICQAVYSVLYEELSPLEAVRALLARELKSEFAL